MRKLLITLILAFPSASALGQSWEAAIRGQQQVIALFLTDLQESFAFLAEEEQQTYIARYRYNLDMHRGVLLPVFRQVSGIGGRCIEPDTCYQWYDSSNWQGDAAHHPAEWRYSCHQPV